MCEWLKIHVEKFRVLQFHIYWLKEKYPDGTKENSWRACECVSAWENRIRKINFPIGKLFTVYKEKPKQKQNKIFSHKFCEIEIDWRIKSIIVLMEQFRALSSRVHVSASNHLWHGKTKAIGNTIIVVDGSRKSREIRFYDWNRKRPTHTSSKSQSHRRVRSIKSELWATTTNLSEKSWRFENITVTVNVNKITANNNLWIYYR